MRTLSHSELVAESNFSSAEPTRGSWQCNRLHNSEPKIAPEAAHRCFEVCISLLSKAVKHPATADLGRAIAPAMSQGMLSNDPRTTVCSTGRSPFSQLEATR